MIEVRVAVIVMLRALVMDWAGLLESVNRTVKLNVPVAVGVPLIAPFALRIIPPGRPPPAKDQV